MVFPIRNDVYTPEAVFQRRLRIALSLAAYAYEFESDSIMDDGDYDVLSLLVDPNVDTGAPDLDFFFSEEFDSSTGQWIRKHPELDKVERLYRWLKYKGLTKLGIRPPAEDNPFDI